MTSINNMIDYVRIPDCLRKYDITKVELFIPRVNQNVTTEMIQQDICSRSWGSVCSIKILNYKNGKRIAFVIVNWNPSYQRAMDDLYNLIETKANIRTFYQDNQHWSWVVNNTFGKSTFPKSGAKTLTNHSDHFAPLLGKVEQNNNNGEKEKDFAPLLPKVDKVDKLDRIGWLSHASPRTLLEYVQELERQRNEFANNLLDVAWSREQHHFYTQEKHKGDIELSRIKSTSQIHVLESRANI